MLLKQKKSIWQKVMVSLLLTFFLWAMVLMSGCEEECNIEYRDFPSGKIAIVDAVPVISNSEGDSINFDIKLELDYSLAYFVERQNVVLNYQVLEDSREVFSSEQILISTGKVIACGEVDSGEMNVPYAMLTSFTSTIPLSPQSEHYLRVRLQYVFNSGDANNESLVISTDEKLFSVDAIAF